MHVSVAASLILAGQVVSPLNALEARHTLAIAQIDVQLRMIAMQQIESEALKLVDEDSLKTPSELRRASNLIASQNDFQHAEPFYELALSAAAGGDEAAKTVLGERWDALLVTMARGRRLGIVKMSLPFGGAPFEVHETAKAIIDTFQDPSSAKKRAETSADSIEIKALVDADQKARSGDFTKYTAKQIAEMMRSDVARLQRIKQIVKRGQLATANDFYSAGLVCQHGTTFDDYALAHELAVCSLILGSNEAPWLAGASYDRMLANCGYPQRFATQYRFDIGQAVHLTRCDVQWISDTERKYVVHTTLEEARNRKFD